MTSLNVDKTPSNRTREGRYRDLLKAIGYFIAFSWGCRKAFAWDARNCEVKDWYVFFYLRRNLFQSCDLYLNWATLRLLLLHDCCSCNPLLIAARLFLMQPITDCCTIVSHATHYWLLHDCFSCNPLLIAARLLLMQSITDCCTIAANEIHYWLLHDCCSCNPLLIAARLLLMKSITDCCTIAAHAIHYWLLYDCCSCNPLLVAAHAIHYWLLLMQSITGCCSCNPLWCVSTGNALKLLINHAFHFISTSK